MADNWDDSDDDDWDVDDDALDAKLGITKKEEPANNFDDEEDLALKEKAEQDRLDNISLKKKGSALAARKQAEKDREDDMEIARKALELEAEMEANMTLDERKMMERKRQEESELEMMGDAFSGGIADGGVGRGVQKAGDKVVMKDMKDHMKHARKVADCMKVSEASLIREKLKVHIESFARAMVIESRISITGAFSSVGCRVYCWCEIRGNFGIGLFSNILLCHR